jgi:hypothetical protein
MLSRQRSITEGDDMRRTVGLTMSRVLVMCAVSSTLIGCTSPSPPHDRNASLPDFESVTMHRSRCFGTCPAYEVKVFADGRVIFTSDDRGDTSGEHQSTITPADLVFLSEAINRVGFATLRDQYKLAADGCTSVATDNATVDITVTRSGATKHVSYYYGCTTPTGSHIDWLAKTIDEVSGTAPWIVRRSR